MSGARVRLPFGRRERLVVGVVALAHAMSIMPCCSCRIARGLSNLNAAVACCCCSHRTRLVELERRHRHPLRTLNPLEDEIARVWRVPDVLCVWFTGNASRPPLFGKDRFAALSLMVR